MLFKLVQTPFMCRTAKQAMKKSYFVNLCWWLNPLFSTLAKNYLLNVKDAFRNSCSLRIKWSNQLIKRTFWLLHF